MMFKGLLISALLFSFSASATLVGTVDIQKVLLSVKEGQKVRDELKKEFEKKQGELKKEEDKIRKAQEDFKKQTLVLSDAAKIKKQESIQKMIMALQQKSMEYQKEIQALESKLKKPLLNKIRTIVEEVSKKEKVDLTFELSVAPIIYAKNQKNLTDLVIKAYDKSK
ncbi:MAG: OmpH family outer membrane protein [Bdellovibrionales bacterium]|jgi:outer membrane protein|nr:OmpH family outer membrane protein [Bdellovibrionales bacterium]